MEPNILVLNLEEPLNVLRRHAWHRSEISTRQHKAPIGRVLKHLGKEKSNVMVKEPAWNAGKLLKQKRECTEVGSTRTQKINPFS